MPCSDGTGVPVNLLYDRILDTFGSGPVDESVCTSASIKASGCGADTDRAVFRSAKFGADADCFAWCSREGAHHATCHWTNAAQLAARNRSCSHHCASRSARPVYRGRAIQDLPFRDFDHCDLLTEPMMQTDRFSDEEKRRCGR